jgi:hypothetical protein
MLPACLCLAAVQSSFIRCLKYVDLNNLGFAWYKTGGQPPRCFYITRVGSMKCANHHSVRVDNMITEDIALRWFSASDEDT